MIQANRARRAIKIGVQLRIIRANRFARIASRIAHATKIPEVSGKSPCGKWGKIFMLNQGCLRALFSMPNMTGRPGCQTMEMNGGSSASYLETEGLLDYQRRAGIISIVRWNLRPVIFGVDFWESNAFPRKVGLRWVCQWAEMGPNVGFWVQKWVKSGSEPTFHPPYHVGIFVKTHFLASLGGWKLFFKVGEGSFVIIPFLGQFQGETAQSAREMSGHAVKHWDLRALHVGEHSMSGTHCTNFTHIPLSPTLSCSQALGHAAPAQNTKTL